MIPLHREDAPDEWARLVGVDDEPIITQVDDGNLRDGKGMQPTSSSSAPTVMALMIDALDLGAGMRVLEVGTGTGYNAAVLAAITGTEVTTIELDPEIADRARRTLDRTGHPVKVVTGDGAVGHPADAPYDRVIATAAVREVPYAWVEQTRPGGRILVPWCTDLEQGGRLLALTVNEDGTAAGGFGQGLSFMHLRQQRPPEPVSWVSDTQEGRYDQSTTQVDPREVLDGENWDAKFVVSLALPALTDGCTRNEDDTHTFRLSHYGSGSWAGFTPGVDEHVVRQHGPRRLWDELEAAYAWWLRSGRPEPARFGLSVTPHGQQVWLDSPGHPIGG